MVWHHAIRWPAVLCLRRIHAEVKDPKRTIPRAIGIALLITIIVYLIIALTLLATLGPAGIAASATEVVLAVVICAVIAVADLRGAVGFSSFGVLIYYLVANIAAFTQPVADRQYPKALLILGTLVCVALVATLPRCRSRSGLPSS